MPELKGSKTVKNVDSRCPKAKPPKQSKQSESEDWDSPSEGEMSLHDSSSDELPEESVAAELRKCKLRNLPKDSVAAKKPKFSGADSDSEFLDVC